MRVVYPHAGGRGWDPVTLLARLAARLLEAELVEESFTAEPSRLTRLSALRPRRRGGEACLLIAPQPGHLQALLAREHRRRRYDHVVGWVIDSFWTERIPLLARGRGHLDALCVTDAELVDHWQDVTRTPTHWLPFGSDVLDRGSGAAERPIDLLRVGRQPAAWEDDDRSAAALAERGLSFAGRTPFDPDPVRNQETLMRAMAQAKFVLAFNNVAAPAVYTHPTRQYLTGRWTDALASGATVAGMRPRCLAADRLLWPGATSQWPSVDMEPGLDALADAVGSWSADIAGRQHLQALRRLDWRHRIAELCDATGLPRTATLTDELARLQSAIAEVEQQLDTGDVGPA